MAKRIWKGNPKLEPFLVRVDRLVLNPNNARGNHDVPAIAHSFETHGQQMPIVVDSNAIVRAGNGRLKAVRHLGWTHIAAVPSDITDPDQLNMFGITDNRTGELSSWEPEQLSKTLKELSEKFSLADTGLWKDHELGPMLDVGWTPPESKQQEDAGKSENAAPGPDMGSPVMLTVDQRLTVDRAIEKVREMEDGAAMSEGRAIELVCGDFLA